MLKKINWQLILDHKIVAGIIAGLVVLIIASLFNSIFGVWISLIVGLKCLWELLIYKIPTPVWVLAILVIVSLGSLIIFFIAWIQSKMQPPWIKYTEDIFDDIRWRWEYSGKNPKNFYPYCPNDDTKFDIDERKELFGPTTTFFICDTCRRQWGHFKGFFHNYQGKIYRQVELKIRNGEWKKVIEEKRKKSSAI